MAIPEYVRPQPPEGYVPLPEVARRTGFSPQGLGGWCRKHPHLAIRLDGRWYFHWERLSAFMATGQPPRRRDASHAGA